MEKREFLYKKDNKIIVKLLVKPNSQKQKILFDSKDKQITIFLKSPPDKGKANKELIKYLAKLIGISTSEISIIGGQTSRDKTVLLNVESIELIKTKLTINE